MGSSLEQRVWRYLKAREDWTHGVGTDSIRRDLRGKPTVQEVRAALQALKASGRAVIVRGGWCVASRRVQCPTCRGTGWLKKTEEARHADRR